MSDSVTQKMLEECRRLVMPRQSPCPTFIIHAHNDTAQKIACALGVEWKPNALGQQRIGDYLLVSRCN